VQTHLIQASVFCCGSARAFRGLSQIFIKRKAELICGQNYPAKAVKEPGKSASFTIKERQSFTVVNPYPLVFNTYSVFLDWKNWR